MKCPRCRHENEAGAKFCEECAAPLARACATCGRPLSPTAKFCPSRPPTIPPTLAALRLEDVRKIRNAVMHFRSESATQLDLEGLHKTETFLVSLQPLTA